jgi:hypothetical protein
MGLYDIGQNFQPGAGTSFNARGAFPTTPLQGSSNIAGTIPLAGEWAAPVAAAQQLFGSEQYKKAKPEEQAVYRSYLPTANPSETQSLMDIFKMQMDPSYRQAVQQEALKFYKEQGDQQMKYNLINRGLTALQTGIERGLTKYQDPYSIANMIATGYAEGARSSAGLAQLGAGIPTRQYYKA